MVMHFHVVRIICRVPLDERKKFTGYSLEWFNSRHDHDGISLNSEIIELILMRPMREKHVPRIAS